MTAWDYTNGESIQVQISLWEGMQRPKAFVVHSLNGEAYSQTNTNGFWGKRSLRNCLRMLATYGNINDTYGQTSL